MSLNCSQYGLSVLSTLAKWQTLAIWDLIKLQNQLQETPNWLEKFTPYSSVSLEPPSHWVPNWCHLGFTKESDVVWNSNTNVVMDLPGRFTITAYRMGVAGCRVITCILESWRIQSKVEGLVLRTESNVDLFRETKVCIEKLKSALKARRNWRHWYKGSGEDWNPKKEKKMAKGQTSFSFLFSFHPGWKCVHWGHDIWGECPSAVSGLHGSHAQTHLVSTNWLGSSSSSPADESH